MKDLHSNTIAHKDGNIHNDANFMENIKGKNNGSSELHKNLQDPDKEPDKEKKNCHEEAPRRLSSTLDESGPMKVKVASREEGTGKNAASYRKQSIRLLPTHSITSTCIHPSPNSAPKTATTTTTTTTTTNTPPTPAKKVLSGNQLQKETKNNANEVAKKKKGNATASIPAIDNSNLAVNQQGKVEDETRERNRILARRRRERKKSANETTKERIDHVSKANEVLRSKNRALIQELVSLGVDERTVMSKINPIPAVSRTSDTNGEDDHHTIEVPRNNQNVELTSNQQHQHQQLQHQQLQHQQLQHQQLQHQHQQQLQHQQHPNQHYQNLLSAFLGRTNTGNSAFLQSAAAGEPPPSQLSSPSPLLLPHHHHQQLQQHQQKHQHSFHSSINAGQQHLWQQKPAMLLGSSSNNGQQSAPIMATSARSKTNPASKLSHHGPQDTAAPAESFLGSSGCTERVNAAEALLASYRHAIMVSQEQRRLSRDNFCESSIICRTSTKSLILSQEYLNLYATVHLCISQQPSQTNAHPHPASSSRGMNYYQPDPLLGAFLPRMEGGIVASQDHLVDPSPAHEVAPNLYSGDWQSHLQNEDEEEDEEDD